MPEILPLVGTICGGGLFLVALVIITRVFPWGGDSDGEMMD